MAITGLSIQDNALTSPLLLQSGIIKEAESRLLATGEEIADANNVFTFLLEAFSTITADCANQTVSAFRKRTYPLRAEVMSDLLRHISDYEYASLYSSPAASEMELYFDAANLISKSELIEGSTVYGKVVISKNATFTVGDLTFGIHYPINIIINKSTRTFAVTWDTTTENPLYSLTQNTIEHRRVTSNGLELLCIKIPVFQFAVATNYEDVSSTSGLIKSYNYSNSFYVARVYTTEDGTTWTEISQSLSNEVYDPDVVTAVVDVITDSNKLIVTIPQTYFDRDMVGSRIKIEIYTTHGEVDVTWSAEEQTDATAVLPEDSTYSAILNRNPTLFMRPSNSTVSGGSDGLTFEEFKSRIVNHTLTTDTLITPGDLERYFDDLGYSVVKYQDGITNRIYRCQRLIMDSDSAAIASAMLKTRLTDDLVDDVSTINVAVDGSYMILPTTLFLYDLDTDTVSPLTDTELATLNGLSQSNKITAYNDNLYTRTPFHTKVFTTGRYPVAYSYDLLEPTIDRTEFVSENNYLPCQLSLYNTTIEHLSDGVGGYRVTLTILPTSDLSELDPSGDDMVVFVGVKNHYGDNVYMAATYSETNDSGNYVFIADFTTEYYLTRNHVMLFSNFADSSGSTNHYLELDIEVDVVTFINKDFELVEGTTIAEYLVTAGAPAVNLHSLSNSVYGTDYVPLSRQTLEISLGNLITQMNNTAKVVAGELEYESYEVAEYATYPADVYETDDDNVPIYTIVDGSVVLTKIHEAGAWLFSSTGYDTYTVDVMDEHDYVGSISSGSALFTLDDAAEISWITTGMPITGAGIPDDTTVIAVNVTGGIITMSADATATTTGITASIMDKATLTGFTSVDDIEVGMCITGVGIPNGATVESIDTDNNAITMNVNAAIGDTGVDVIIGYPVVTHAAGELVLINGEPTETTESRDLTYLINCPHVDAKFLLSDEPEHEDYISSIVEQFRTHFGVVDDAKDHLLENTELFFQPFKSLGTASFITDDGVTTTNHNLCMTFGFRLFVVDTVMTDESMQDLIRDNILTIIDAQLETGVVSCTQIAASIMSEMSDNVSNVDILGIDEDAELQTLIDNDDDSSPSIKHELVLNDDNTIGVERGLTLEFVSA